MPETEATEPKHEFICEVCDKTVTLTNAEAYDAGWDYPPFMGQFGIISARTCEGCGIDKTVWWALISGTPVTDLDERQRAVVQRILTEQPR